VRAALIEAFELGAPQSVACAVARISVSAFCSWMQQARGEREGYPPTPELLELVEEVEAAKSRHSMTLLGSVKTTVVGRFCNVCTNGIYKGKICPVCKGTEEARKPDGKLALQVLARRHPEYREPKAEVVVDQRVSGRVEVASVALTVNLAEMTPQQLSAMMGRGGDVIEAEEEGEDGS
jgi:hypothetical protein